MDFDVLIVGLGPVGATLANLLAKRGVSVAVVDSQVSIFEKPRAITIDHEVMRIFQACGIAQRLLPATAIHPGTDYLGMDGRIIKKFDPMPMPHPLGWAPTGFFIQPIAEQLLRNELRDSGVPTYLGYAVEGVNQDEEQVEISLTDPAGTKLRGKYLVACDGANSHVRRQLGIPLEDLKFDEWWMVADAHLKGEAELPFRCRQYCWPERPATYLPYTGNLRRWEIKLLPSDDPQTFGEPENVLRQLSRFVDTAAIEVWRSAVYRFHALLAARWREGRILLAGDACHQMPPFLGQGLCSGLRDAYNLAWKLEAVLNAKASSSLLDTYEQERKPHVASIVRSAKEFGLIIGELDVEAAGRRDTTLREQLLSGKSETVRQKYIPDLQHGLIDSACSPTTAGTLFVQPHVRLRGSLREQLLDGVVEPGFLLLASDPEPFQWLCPEEQATLDRINVQRVLISPDETAAEEHFSVAETEGLFANWLKANACRVVLVRPDRYVYGVASNRDGLKRLVAHFAEHMPLSKEPAQARHQDTGAGTHQVLDHPQATDAIRKVEA